jgi:hypothetical protein
MDYLFSSYPQFMPLLVESNLAACNDIDLHLRDSFAGIATGAAIAFCAAPLGPGSLGAPMCAPVGCCAAAT